MSPQTKRKSDRKVQSGRPDSEASVTNSIPEVLTAREKLRFTRTRGRK